MKEKRTAVPAVLFVFRIKTSDVLLHALGGGVLVRADGDGELHAILLDWLDRFSEENCVKFTVTLSLDESMATEGMRSYL